MLKQKVNMDPLDGVAAFVSAVQAGSFAAASRRLQISKSAVSAHVHRIEERLGVQLLHRMKRELSLTEVGAVYYRHCVRIVAEAEFAEKAARGLRRGVATGNVDLCSGDICPMHVAPAIPEFLSRFPGIVFDVLLTRNVDTFQEGRDLAICFGRLRDSPLTVRQLASLRFVFCAAPSYLEMRGVPESWTTSCATNVLG